MVTNNFQHDAFLEYGQAWTYMLELDMAIKL